MKTLSPDNSRRNAKGDAGDERHGAKHDDRNAAVLHWNRMPTGCGFALQPDTGLHCWLRIGTKNGLAGDACGCLRGGDALLALLRISPFG